MNKTLFKINLFIWLWLLSIGLLKAQTPIDYSAAGFPNTYSNGVIINGFTAWGSDMNGTDFSWTFQSVLTHQAFSRATNLLGWPEMFEGKWNVITNIFHTDYYIDPDAFQLTAPFFAGDPAVMNLYALNCNTNYPLIIYSKTSLSETDWTFETVITNPTATTLFQRSPVGLTAFFRGYQDVPAPVSSQSFEHISQALRYVTFTCGLIIPLTFYYSIRKS